MRDPNRIREVLNRLRVVWEAYPDLRLGQLLLNVGDDPVLYYIEDNVLIKAIEDFYLGEKE